MFIVLYWISCISFTVLLLSSFIQGWSGLDDRRRGSVFSHRWHLMYENLTMLNLQNGSNWTGPNNWYHPADTITPQHGTGMWALVIYLLYLLVKHLSMWTYTECVCVPAFVKSALGWTSNSYTWLSTNRGCQQLHHQPHMYTHTHIQTRQSLALTSSLSLQEGGTKASRH